jgi:hypothetical protein
MLDQDQDEEFMRDVSELSAPAKDLFKRAIVTECTRTWPMNEFGLEDVKVSFPRGSRAIHMQFKQPDPSQRVQGAGLEDWVDVINQKSVWQFKYGGGSLSVASNGKNYKLYSVKPCK